MSPNSPPPNGKEVLRMDSLLISIASGVISSIIAYFICRALERHFGDK